MYDTWQRLVEIGTTSQADRAHEIVGAVTAEVCKAGMQQQQQKIENGGEGI